MSGADSGAVFDAWVGLVILAVLALYLVGRLLMWWVQS